MGDGSCRFSGFVAIWNCLSVSLFSGKSGRYKEYMAPSSQFVFMTCRSGAEGAVKEEVARLEPSWRLSFSRPGFVTFKQAGERPLDERQLAERNWTFAHAHGISLCRLSGQSLDSLTQQVWNSADVARLVASGGPDEIHVWQPGTPLNDEQGGERSPGPLCTEIQAALRRAAPAEYEKLRAAPAGRSRPAPRNALVLDVLVLEPGQWWIGYHRAVRRHERWPGGFVPVPAPELAVSRAYSKMEEALKWSGLPLAEGDECVEIGCAPGGSSQALLDRGLFVTGVDPADVDPAVLEHPRFRHLKKRGKDVRRKEFQGVRWLAADMNIAPAATLDEVETIVAHPGITIRGLILTLKFSDWPRKCLNSLPACTVGGSAKFALGSSSPADRKSAWLRCAGRHCGAWAGSSAASRIHALPGRRAAMRLIPRCRGRISDLRAPGHFG
jgi:23S rRNA (cytidine2498-2'-O)-methyltransferase